MFHRFRRRQLPERHVDLGHGARLEGVGQLVQLFAQHFRAEARFESLELVFDGIRLLLVADHVFAVALEEVADGLDADLDRAGRLVFVDILEAEVRRAGVLHNFLDHRVNRRVVAALEARELQRHQVGMPRDILGGPDLAAGVLAVRVLPEFRNG